MFLRFGDNLHSESLQPTYEFSLEMSNTSSGARIPRKPNDCSDKKKESIADIEKRLGVST